MRTDLLISRLGASLFSAMFFRVLLARTWFFNPCYLSSPSAAWDLLRHTLTCCRAALTPAAVVAAPAAAADAEAAAARCQEAMRRTAAGATAGFGACPPNLSAQARGWRVEPVCGNEGRNVRGRMDCGYVNKIKVCSSAENNAFLSPSSS